MFVTAQVADRDPIARCCGIGARFSVAGRDASRGSGFDSQAGGADVNVRRVEGDVETGSEAIDSGASRERGWWAGRAELDA